MNGNIVSSILTGIQIIVFILQIIWVLKYPKYKRAKEQQVNWILYISISCFFVLRGLYSMRSNP